MIGVGFTGGTVNVGPSFSNSKSSNTGKVAFVDIDGDGLPDKLFKQGNKLFYRKNMSADGKDLLFGKALPIRGVNSFSEGNSISRSLNADAAVEVGITKNLVLLLEFLIHIQKIRTRLPPIFMISTVMDLQT